MKTPVRQTLSEEKKERQNLRGATWPEREGNATGTNLSDNQDLAIQRGSTRAYDECYSTSPRGTRHRRRFKCREQEGRGRSTENCLGQNRRTEERQSSQGKDLD